MTDHQLIYRCVAGHISFAKELKYCGMKDCRESIDKVSDIEIEWFYKISPNGLAIPEKDLDMILKDRNMPKDVKKAVKEIIPYLQ